MLWVPLFRHTLPSTRILFMVLLQVDTPPSWWALNWGSFVSSLGLGVSIITLVVSRRAKQAAEDARDSIYQQTLATELNNAAINITYLHTVCDSGRFDLASHLSYQAVQKTAFLSQRWYTHLDDSSKKTLSRASAQLDTIVSQLLKFRAKAPIPEELNSLLGAIKKVNQMLNEEAGKYEAHVSTLRS
jgi:hypothetical protein